MADEFTSSRRRLSRPASPSTRDILAILFRQRRILVLTFVAVFLGSIVYARVTRSYTAEMKILLGRGRVDPPVSTGAPLLLRHEVGEEELKSEAELLRDGDTLRRVAQAAHLDENAGWLQPRVPEARLQRATKHLGQNLRVEPVRKTKVLNVSYDCGDPKIAAKVLDLLAAVYLEKHARAQRPTGEFAFFEQQVTRVGEQLTARERQLLAMNDRGVIQPDLQRDVALQKLADAENELKRVVISISEAEERVRTLQVELASLPERTTTQVRTADNPQLLEKLKSTLLNLQLRRTELLTRFQPDYRLVQEVDREIADAKAALAAEALNPVRDETTALNQQSEWARTELEKSRVELQALRARYGAARIVVAEYESRTRQLGRDSMAQRALLRDSKADEESYLSLLKKREEAAVGDALDQRGILNATVIQPPIVPAFPRQSLLTSAALGLSLALLLSTGAAFACDVMSGTFRTPEEVARVLNTPLVTWLPAWETDTPGAQQEKAA